MAKLPKRFIQIGETAKVENKRYKAVIKDMSKRLPFQVCDTCDLNGGGRCMGVNLQCSKFDRADEQFVDFKMIDDNDD